MYSICKDWILVLCESQEGKCDYSIAAAKIIAIDMNQKQRPVCTTQVSYGCNCGKDKCYYIESKKCRSIN